MTCDTIPTFVVGDTARRLRATITDANGLPVNLTGATVVFAWRLDGAPASSTGTALIVDAEAGIVEYAWAVGNLTAAGSYTGEFRVTFPSTSTLTAPSDGPISFVVRDPV